MVLPHNRYCVCAVGDAMNKISKTPCYKYIIGAMRKVWRWSPARAQVKRDAKGVCAKCGDKPERLEIDHKEGVAYESWNAYMSTLFCEADKLWALCKKCHKKKSAEERKRRKEI